MNLVDQIFEQARAGSAQGQGFGQFLEAGVQAGQRQQQLNMELAQLPLKMKLAEQDAAYKKAETQTLLDNRQAEADAAEAYAGLASTVRPLLATGKIDEAQNAIIDAGSNNAFLLADPRKRLHTLFEMTTQAQNAKLELAKAKQQQFTPQEVLVPSKIPGQPPYAAIQTGPNSFTLPQSTVTEFTTPEGAVFSQRTGAGGAPASSANNPLTNKIESKLADTTRATALLDESLSLISPENIGPRGKINAAVEKGANILAPGSMATPVTKAQATFNATAQAQYNALKADSQINKMEAAAMDKIAKVTDWWEAAATAHEKYQTLRDLTGLQAILASHSLNRITPDNILKGMSLDFVNKYWLQNKTITDAELQRWIDLHGGKAAVERMLLPQ